MQAEYGAGSTYARSGLKTLAISIVAVYLASIAAFIVGGVVEDSFSANSSPFGSTGPFGDNPPSPITVTIILGGFMGLFACLTQYAIFLYKGWKVVQDGQESLSPGAAAALGVAPFVSLVGVFFAFHGLARELNRVNRQLGLGRPRVSEGMAMAAAICYVIGAFSCIPLLGCLASPVGLVGTVLWMIGLFQMATSADAIVAARASGILAVAGTSGPSAAHPFGAPTMNPFAPPDQHPTN